MDETSAAAKKRKREEQSSQRSNNKEDFGVEVEEDQLNDKFGERQESVKQGGGGGVDGDKPSDGDDGEDGEDGEDESDGEDGEIVEECSFQEKLSRMWTSDLKNPPRSRIVLNPLHHVCSNWRELNVPDNGLWLEFGVYSGKTINNMAELAPRHTTVFGFDSFEGLKDEWRPGFEKGKFDMQGRLPRVYENVELIKGWFEESLKPFLEERFPINENSIAHTTPISICHLDADVYDATKYVLETLSSRIVQGTVLVFDELINYPEYRHGEWKALLEATEKFGWKVEFIAQSGVMEENPRIDVWSTQQVAVRIVSTTA